MAKGGEATPRRRRAICCRPVDATRRRDATTRRAPADRPPRPELLRGAPLNADLLARVEPFRNLDERSLAALAEHCDELDLSADHVVFHHGDPADALYIVVRGGATVTRDEVGKPLQLLARLGENDFFGEQGLFEGRQRSATVRTTQPTTLLRIARGPLLAFADARPEIALRLQVAAAQRHSSNAAVTLDLGRQGDVRIRLGKPARLELPDGSTVGCTIENLSAGGMSLSGVPDSWQAGLPVRFHLTRGTISLPVAGRVTWRRGRVAGMAFTQRDSEHDLAIWRAIRQILHED